jgi:pimeloyl-ACP methyl ester carboxylesterase
VSDSLNVYKKHDQTIRHPTGRVVQYSIFGASDLQKVVFYSHGFPASRVEAVIAHRAALERGVTLVALDRPGFGASQWYPERSFEDWAGDVRLVADHLGVERFSVLGVSGGTPTAVAAAGAMPERVLSLVIVSGIAPVVNVDSLRGMNLSNKGLLLLGRHVPWLARWSVWGIAQLWRMFPGLVAIWFGVLLPAVDRSIVRRREVGVVLAKNIKEALSQGVRRAVSEFMLLASDWSPLLRQVRVPTTVWHGDADSYVPFYMGEAVHKAIAGSTFRKVVGGGHFMILDTIEEVLESVA